MLPFRLKLNTYRMVAVLDNTVLVTLPILVFVTVVALKYIKLFTSQPRHRVYARWLCIGAVMCGVFIPSVAALAASLISIVAAVLMMLIARNLGKVHSGESNAVKLYAQAVVILLLGQVPLVVTTRLLG